MHPVLFLLAAAPPSPPIVPLPAPVTVVIPRPDTPINIDTVQVDVSAEGRPIWQGTLRVARDRQASYTQQLQQAYDVSASCHGDSRVSNQRDQLSVQLSRYGRAGATDGLNVSASWTRSAKSELCGGYEAPSRTVSLVDMVDLKSGRPAKLSGDGGLLITLRLVDRSSRITE